MNAEKMTPEAGAYGEIKPGPFVAARRARFNIDDLPGYLRVASVVLRSTFIAALLVVVALVSAPQQPGNTWLDMPSGDMVRVAMGAVFCLCMLRQLFRFPKDASAYRTWFYLGLALAPLSVTCVIALW
jgi:hypothetical protein